MAKTFRQFKKTLLEDRVNVNELKRLYAEFNRKFFENSLPDIPIKISNRLKGSTAQVVLKVRKERGRIVEIVPGSLIMKFNGNLDFTEEQLQGILLHEMIHVEMNIGLDERSIRDSQSHGIVFEAKRKDLEKRSRIKIPVTDSVTEISGEIGKEPVGVILWLDDKSQKKSLTFISDKTYQENFSAIIERLKKLIVRNSSTLKIFTFRTETNLTKKFPVKRKITGLTSYFINDKTFDDLLKSAIDDKKAVVITSDDNNPNVQTVDISRI